MTFDWEDYLVLSEALVSGRGTISGEEACLRSAISRAYYSAFISARNFLCRRGEWTPTRTGKDHPSVRNHFKDSTDGRRQQIWAWLDRIADNRRKADYDDVFRDNLTKSAEASVRAARQLLSSLRRLP